MKSELPFAPSSSLSATSQPFLKKTLTYFVLHPWFNVSPIVVATLTTQDPIKSKRNLNTIQEYDSFTFFNEVLLFCLITFVADLVPFFCWIVVSKLQVIFTNLRLRRTFGITQYFLKIGGRLIFHYRSKVANGPRCGDCGRSIQGVLFFFCFQVTTFFI